MGGVTDLVKCPKCKSKESLYRDYNYRSEEEWGVCNKCGWGFSHKLKRDESNKLIRELTHSYDLTEGKVFYATMACSMKNRQDERILYKMPVSPNDTENDIRDFIDMQLSKKNPEKFKEFERFKKKLDKDEYSYHNLYFIDDNNKPLQIWYNTVKLEISDGHLNVYDVIWESSESGGYGVVEFEENGVGSLHCLNEGEVPELTKDVIFASMVKDGELIILKGKQDE